MIKKIGIALAIIASLPFLYIISPVFLPVKAIRYLYYSKALQQEIAAREAKEARR